MNIGIVAAVEASGALLGLIELFSGMCPRMNSDRSSLASSIRAAGRESATEYALLAGDRASYRIGAGKDNI